MRKTTKLIILRGPSGSGKTTTARKVFDQVTEQTTLIEQDYYRFIFKPAGGDRNNSKTIHKMIKSNILAALEDNYNVITEGIYSLKAYKETFAEIFKIHRDNNYIFTFDVSFEETLNRHRTKPNKDDWTEQDMRGWYNPQDYLGYDFETIINENMSQAQIIKLIKTTAEI